MEGNDKQKVTINFIGDVYLPSSINHEVIDNELSSSFQDSDFNVFNLEAPLSSKTHSSTIKKCLIQSDPKHIETLKKAKLNVACLANNHVFDQGEKGFQNSRLLLNDNDIKNFGAGNSQAEAIAPLEISDKIAVIGASWDFIQSTIAGKNSPGVGWLNTEILLSTVREAKKKYKTIILCTHWGYEKETHPLPFQRELSHTLIDNGVDLIIGHHPHVIQGKENYKGKWIYYSLGNFIFPDIKDAFFNIKQNEDQKTGLILKVGIDSEGTISIDEKLSHFDGHKVAFMDKPASEILTSLSNQFTQNYRRDYKLIRSRKNAPILNNNASDKLKILWYRFRMFYLNPILLKIMRR
jgi:hypothetical protein